MRKLKISKKTLPLLAAGITLVSLSGCNEKTESIKKENLVGYIDEQPDKVDQEDFIIYNVGNHSRIGIKKQDKYLKKCEELGISTGIIIESDAKAKIDIYEDVEYVKGIIEQNNIDFPVYLNPKNIIDNKELSAEEKGNLISEFLTILERNDIYTGLYGTSSDLQYINDCIYPIGIKYDCFLVEDGKTEYTGKASVRKDKRNNIESIYQSKDYEDNLAKMIEYNNLNKKESLKQTGYHKVQNEETLRQISFYYNLSENDILQFNEIDEKNIKPGTILRIPNRLQDEKEEIIPDIPRLDTAAYRGIDISHYQGDPQNVSFMALRKRIDFAILKISEQEPGKYNIIHKDNYFNAYYERCIDSGIMVGAYYVTHATNAEDARKEAQLVIDEAKKLKLTFPIFIDYENTVNTGYEEEFNKIINDNQLGIILETVNEMFKKENIRFGVYCSLSTYEQMVNEVGLKQLEQYEIWLSCPKEYYTHENQVLDNGNVCQTDNKRYAYHCDINQVSERITDLGIGNDEGFVDYDLCYKKYDIKTQLIDVEPTMTFETKKYDRRNSFEKRMIVIKTLGIPTISLLGLYTYGHRRKIKKYVRTIANKIH